MATSTVGNGSKIKRRGKERIHMPAERSLRAVGETTERMGSGGTSVQAVLGMKETIIKATNTERASIMIQVEHFTKEIFSITRGKDMGHTLAMSRRESTQASGTITKYMGKAKCGLQMAINTLESLLKMLDMAKANSYGQTALNTMAIGLTVSNPAKGVTQTQMG